MGMRDWLKRRRRGDTVEEEGEGQTAERKRSGWYLRFARQELRGYSPILTGKAVIIYLLCTSVVFIAFGIPLLTASTGVVEYNRRYDDQGQFANLNETDREALIQGASDSGIPVQVEFLINKTMEPPVYLYYHLASFHQNHKRYVRSRGDAQLGDDGNTTSTCQPQEYVSHTGQGNPSLPNGGAIDPCGLMAWSFFNDTYSVSVQSGAGAASQNVTVDDGDIAWTNDRDHLYGHFLPIFWNYDAATRGGTNNSASTVNSPVVYINENQHFMVWMRPAAQPTVRKTWGVINQRLEAGSIVTVTVQNRYNTYGFSGPKLVVLSTNSWVGAKDTFLGIAYIVCACLSFVAAIVFFIAYYLGVATKRKYGDVTHLSWNRH